MLTRFDALGSTLTSRVTSGNDAPGARLSLRRQVTVRAAMAHDHPWPVAETGVSPAGTTSVMTTSPAVGAVPMFVTVI